MVEVYLIGTLHKDIHGPNRLKRRLYEIKPEIILVEGDPLLEYESNLYLFILEQELKNKNLNPAFIDVILGESKIMGSSFEEPVSKEYCLGNGAQFNYLGDFDKSQPAFKMVFEAKKSADGYVRLTLEQFLHNVEHIQRENQLKIDEAWKYFKIIEGIDEEKNFALSRIEAINQTLGFSGGLGRDKQMEAKLRSAIQANPDSIIATITGYNHILNDPQNRTLYRRVRDLNPHRVFLYD